MSDRPTTEAVYRFANCELDAASRQLRFDGRPVDVQPRVFDLLEYLLRNRGRAVGKDELFENIWPNMVVSESSLSQTIKRARAILRDHGVDDEVIRTVHSRGYRVDIEVSESGPAEPPPSKTARKTPGIRRRAVLGGVLTAVLLAVVVAWFFADGSRQPPGAPQNSLVVLPFANLTADEEFAWFSDGLTETLAQALTRVNGLRIIGRASANSFRGTDTAHREIGERLNVAHILEGTVQRAGDRLRISASLVAATDGNVLWSQSYDSEMDDVFSVQDAIARSCVQRMEAIVTEQLSQPDDTEDVDPYAYQLYLRASRESRLRQPDSLANAEALYRDALRIEPQFKRALLGLSSTLYRKANMGTTPRDETFSEAVSLIRQALELDPDFADAYLVLGEIQHRHYWQFREARDSFETAIRLQPGLAEAHSAYARFLSKIGHHDEAVVAAELGRELNPLSSNANSSLVLRLVRAYRLDRAREVLDAMHAHFPENGDLPWLESLWNLQSGNYGEALSRIAEEPYEYLRLSISAIAYHHLGRTDQARQQLERLIETDGEGATFQIAEVYAQWQMPDETFAWLDKAVAGGDPGVTELLSSINFEPVYNDPRFDTMLDRVGLRLDL